MPQNIFGTDGVRGVANADLSCDLAFRLGRAATSSLARTSASAATRVFRVPCSRVL